MTVVDAQPMLDALVGAVAAQGLAVAVSRKPSVAAGLPWVVVWPDGGVVGDDTMASRDGWSTVVAFHCVGLSVESALFATRKVRAAVLGLHRAVVDGRTVQMPEHREPPPMQRDDDADPPVFIQYDEWRIRTTA